MSRQRIILTVLVVLPVSASAQPNPVVDAARARQDQFKSIIIEYRQTSRVFLTATLQRPASESTASAENRIVIDGDKVRVENNNPSVSMGQGFFRQSRIEVFDEQESRTLFPLGIGPDPTPIGIRHEKTPKIEAGIPEPIFLHFRGLDPAYRMFAIDTWKATGRTMVIDGAKCNELELPLRDHVRRAWFDPSKGHVAVRIESEINDRVSHRTSISYRNDPATGWLPARWRTEDLNPDGSSKYVWECEITRLILNKPIDEREFEVKFAPGTIVNDQNTKRDYRVLDDGSLYEYSATDLFGTPKRTTFRQWVARNAWTVVLVASALLLGLLPILVRRRTRVITSPAA